MQLETDGEIIILRPVRPNVVLKKELGVWVFQGSHACDFCIPDLIEKSCEWRHRLKD
jgi:hypothetical protein